MSKIKTPIQGVADTKQGDLVVKFADKKDLEKAKTEFERDKEHITVSEKKKKMQPKIKIVNVSKLEGRDDVIQNLRFKNDWLDELIKGGENFELLKEIDGRFGDIKHCIFKCTPKIRRAICDRGNKIHTLYQNCNVYDTYMPYQCYKCQEFGHSASNCTNKQVCPRCGEEHNANQCKKQNPKCINCQRKNYNEIDHRAYDENKCPIYREEIARVRNNTDHGCDE